MGIARKSSCHIGAVSLGLILAVSLAVATQGDTQEGEKGTFRTGASLVVPAFETIAGAPLTIRVAEDMSFQTSHNTLVGTGQIFPPGAIPADMGVLVDIGGTLFAPDFAMHSGTATSGLGTFTPWSNTVVNPVVGSGTFANPFMVTASADAGLTGLHLDLKVNYTNGDPFFKKFITLVNTTGGPLTFSTFLGSDIYLNGSDSGKPFGLGGAGGRQCGGTGARLVHVPLNTAADRRTADSFSSVWSQIGAANLNNAINPINCIDNGAALQWNRTLAAGNSVTFAVCTTFASSSVFGRNGCVSPRVSVNKDFSNTTGQTVNDAEIVLLGQHQVFSHVDGPFPSFSAMPVGTNTLLRWSGASVVNNGQVHLGYTVPGSVSPTILGVSWTLNNTFAGCARQVTGPGRHLLSGALFFDNLATSCSVGPVHVGNVRVEYHEAEVPLEELNATAVRNPAWTYVLPSDAVSIPVGGRARVATPPPPPSAGWAVLIWDVDTDPSLPAATRTTDYVQIPIVPPENNIPTLSEWGLILLALLLAGVGVLFVARRRATATA